MQINGTGCACNDCKAILMLRPSGLFGSSWDVEWYLVKDHVWRAGQSKGACRFLCVACLEHRIGRKLMAADFKRSAKVNFVGNKSTRLRQRMHELKPAKRLIETTFKLSTAPLNVALWRRRASRPCARVSGPTWNLLQICRRLLGPKRQSSSRFRSGWLRPQSQSNRTARPRSSMRLTRAGGQPTDPPSDFF